MFGALLMVILCNVLIVSVYATSVTVETGITQDFHVVYTFSDINETIYGNIKSNMTEDTVPTALHDNMVQKGHTGVDYYNQSISFNDNASSIISAFNLQGTSIINSTINRAAKTETFRMNTEWREFYLNVTTDFYFNFTQDLAQPLSSWTSSTVGDVTSYSYSNSTAEVMTFSFQLPSYASNIAVSGDTITFDAPYKISFEDSLISSPILILIALAVAGVIVYVYRKIR
jgi:hypothetical protein